MVQAQYEHRTAADTHLQYHCAQGQRVLLFPLMWLNCLCHNLTTPTDHEGGKNWDIRWSDHAMITSKHKDLPKKFKMCSADWFMHL